MTNTQRFPGESDAYRAARDALLTAEIDLRRRVEAVAAMRRNLPPGGPIKENYVFDEGAADLTDRDTVVQTRFSDLFAPGKDSLIVYSFMYGTSGDPCPMCTALLDSLNANAPFVTQRVNLAVVAKAPIQKIRDFAHQRGWENLRLLSSGNNGYNTDYSAETPDGRQIPPLNIFYKSAAGIHHTYNAELLYADSDPDQHPRHADPIWPLWNLFDLTPEGRGSDWFPQIT